MVKRREVQVATVAVGEESKEAAIEEFGARADDNSPSKVELNPNAKRDFKEIRLPLNEYEFKLLDEGAKKTGRSRLNFIRWAISQSCTE